MRQKAFNSLSFGLNDTITSFAASMDLDHRYVSQKTALCSSKYHELFLFGCTTVMSPQGKFLKGKDIQILIDNGVCSTSQMLGFLAGELSSGCPALAGYEVLTTAHFEVVKRADSTVVSFFDVLAKDFSFSENCGDE